MKTRRKSINLDFQVNIDICQLASNIVHQLHNNNNELEKFIVLLDKAAEDWEVTNNLIQHFKTLEKVMIKALGDDCDLTPKEIKI